MYTCDVNAMGTLRILQAIVTLGLQKKVKFYNVRLKFSKALARVDTILFRLLLLSVFVLTMLQACSSEVYGQTSATLQDESTRFYPVSPYAASKAFAYWLTISARASYGLFAVNGILFNHESPRRGLLRIQLSHAPSCLRDYSS